MSIPTLQSKALTHQFDLLGLWVLFLSTCEQVLGEKHGPTEADRGSGRVRSSSQDRTSNHLNLSHFLALKSGKPWAPSYRCVSGQLGLDPVLWSPIVRLTLEAQYFALCATLNDLTALRLSLFTSRNGDSDAQHETVCVVRLGFVVHIESAHICQLLRWKLLFKHIGFISPQQWDRQFCRNNNEMQVPDVSAQIYREVTWYY